MTPQRKRAVERVADDMGSTVGLVEIALMQSDVIGMLTGIAVSGWERAIVAEGLLERAAKLMYCNSQNLHLPHGSPNWAYTQLSKEIRSFLSAEGE